MRTGLAIALLLIAACHRKDESRIAHTTYGMYTRSGVPGHEATIEVVIPESFLPASIENVIVIDDKGRRHDPKEAGMTRGSTNTLSVRVALPDDAKIRAIHAGNTIIDLENDRFTKAPK